MDLGLFQRLLQIEDSLHFREGDALPNSCDVALEWCSENRAVLRKINSSLELELRLQEFIELVRPGTMEGRRKAVMYARKHFPSYMGYSGNSYVVPEYRDRIQRAMGILAVRKSSGFYADLYDLKRWHTLRKSFWRTALKAYHLPPMPLIHIALSAGLSTLKTLTCTPMATSSHDSVDQHPENFVLKSQRDCPTCEYSRLGSLAAKVPRNRRENSTLICRVTEKVMDDQNPPMCLPNGMVYSQEVRHMV